MRFKNTISIISIIVGIIFFASADKVPVTEFNYEPLKNQMNAAIEQNPDLLLQTNCEVSIKKDIIEACIMNDECILTGLYNQNFKLLSTWVTDV